MAANNDNSQLHNVPNTPDITIIKENSRTVTIVEIGCSFDLHSCFNSEMLYDDEYQPLLETITDLGFHCQLGQQLLHLGVLGMKNDEDILSTHSHL